MSYSWQPLTPDQVEFYRLGVESAVAKCFTNWNDFARELYYSRVIHEQPWATDGFLKPLGYHADPQHHEYMVFYPPTTTPSYENLRRRDREGLYTPYRDYLIRSVYWLARANLFLTNLTDDTLGFIERSVSGPNLVDGALVLITYQLADLTELDPATLFGGRFQSDILTIQQARDSTVDERQRAWERLVIESIRRVGVRSVDRSILNRLAVNPPPFRRPSLVGSLSEFEQQLRRQLSPQYGCVVRRIGSGGYGCVYEPPVDYRPIRSGRYVGKIHFENYDDRSVIEATAARLLDDLDPTGEFHPRLVEVLEVYPPEMDAEYYGDEQFKELVFEHGGRALVELGVLESRTHRLWFYLGLERFLGFLERMADARLVHLDLRVDNVVVDEWYNVRMIDFDLLSRYREVILTHVHSSVYYPLDVVYESDFERDGQQLMIERWTSYLDGTYQSWSLGQEPIKSPTNVSLLHDLHNTNRDGFLERLKSFTQQLNRLSPAERRHWIINHIDGYTLGVSMLLKLTDRSVVNELQPVLYHLVAYDIHDRRVSLARVALRKLIESLEEQIGVPFNQIH